MANNEERERIMAEYMASVQGDQCDDEEDDDDDDEEEEADFEPEEDDDDDDDEDDDEFSTKEQDEPLMLYGTLLSDADGKLLTYKGNTSNGDQFSFRSCKHLHWNPSLPIDEGHNGTNSSTTTRSIPMEGGIDTAKKTAVTFLIESSDTTTTVPALGKSTGESDEEDNDVKPTAAPEATTHPVVYKITATATTFSFSGTLSQSGNLNCVYDLIFPGRTVAATAAASKLDDTDEEDVDADEGIGYDELIALHQDAGMPVEQVRKRNHERSSRNEDNGNNSRRLKTDSTEVGDNDDNDDDEEFEGF